MNMGKDSILQKIRAVIFGHAVGDALGVPVEFCTREELDESPLTDMEGFGTYPYPAGCWSDDTSMSIAALDSIADGEINYDDIMLRFGRWYYKDEYTPTGEMFDVGNTCSFAIDNYFVNKKSSEECGLFDERSNGNGSLMRIHPFSLLAYTQPSLRAHFETVTDKASALTHAHERSMLACRIFTVILFELLDAPLKASVRKGISLSKQRFADSGEYMHFGRLFSDDFEGLPRDEIRSTGYVVDTLEAVVWCLLNTDSYKECVLTAANLGDDTDTVAAIAGALAGALYGYSSIPREWLDVLKRADYIDEMCKRAADAWYCE